MRSGTEWTSPGRSFSIDRTIGEARSAQINRRGRPNRSLADNASLRVGGSAIV